MSRYTNTPQGALRPPNGKSLSRGMPIRNALIPPIATVPLRQHLGADALCLVTVGQRVTEGMKIGGSQGPIGASIHAPIPGVVTAIRETGLADGSRSAAVTIALGGAFERLAQPVVAEETASIPRAEIIARIAEAGVVGLGGTAFPTHLKLAAASRTKISTLVVNALESDPYATGDYRLLLERSGEIAKGSLLVAQVCAPGRVLIAIDASCQDASSLMRSACESAGLAVEIVELDATYPAGDERTLVHALLGTELPAGSRPEAIGVVVLNVATIVAIYDAVALRKPLFERVVTLSGGALRTPANLKVRFGTPIGDVLEECGGLSVPAARIVVSGALAGQIVADMAAPVTKGISSILALTAEEVREATSTPCIGCGRCIEVCPVGLDPMQLYKLVSHGELSDATDEGLLDCRECGCCGYVCPSRLPLVAVFQVGRRRARAGGPAL